MQTHYACHNSTAGWRQRIVFRTLKQRQCDSEEKGNQKSIHCVFGLFFIANAEKVNQVTKYHSSLTLGPESQGQKDWEVC